jgi:hypothetical protein
VATPPGEVWSKSAKPVCRHCGADNPASFRCWLCGGMAPLGREALATTADATGSGVVTLCEHSGAVAQERAARTVDSSVWVLVIAGIAVMVGVFVMSPGLAVGLVVLATPALIRAVRHSDSGAGASFAVFFSTLGITFGLILAAIIAFCVVCFAMLSSVNFH